MRIQIGRTIPPTAAISVESPNNTVDAGVNDESLISTLVNVAPPSVEVAR